MLGAHINYGVEPNDKDSKFKVVDQGRISKSKKIFAQGCTPI